MATDTKSPGEKTLSVSSTKTLTLKPRVETGVVRQSFSHGRSKAVVVEKVKRRIGGPGEAKAPEPAPRRRAGARRDAAPRRRRRSAAQRPRRLRRRAAPRRAPKPSGVVLRTLTEEERDRARACARRRPGARGRRAQDRRGRGAIRAERDAIERTEREAAEARKRDEEERRRHDEETKRKADEDAKKRFGGEEEGQGRDDRPAPRRRPRARSTPGSRGRRSPSGAPRRRRRAGAPGARARRPPRAGAPKQRGRLTLVDRAQRRRGARAFGRLVPPPHAAHDRPSRQRAEGKARPRSHDPGDHHHPGTRQPHVGARAST